MPRTLFLLRHAQSAEKQQGQRDLDRELTTQGVQEALKIAVFFSQQGLMPDIIVCSTASRAKSTANLIADTIRYGAERIVYSDELYEASLRTFLSLINEIDDRHQQVLFVGHNPTISFLAEYLTKAEIGEMVPAGLTRMQLSVDSWKEVSNGTGELLDYTYPALLRRL